MKTRVTIVVFLIAAFAAFAQGRIRFGNDTAHPIVFTSNLLSLWPEEQAYAGQLLPVSPLPPPSGLTFTAQLFAGTSSSSLSLQASVVLNSSGLSSPGLMAGTNVTLSIPGGATQFFLIQVVDDSFNNDYLASTGIFTAIPGTSLSYPGIVSGTAANSTWLPSNLVIASAVPEPCTAAIASLALAIFLGRRSFGRR